MYKLLLCLRYLRTRYIALASIVSVTLGVATMIVVNSVMAGFTTEMKDRIRGLLADVVIETHSLAGVEDADALIARAKRAAPGMIEAATPTVEMYAVMTYPVHGIPVHRPVQLIGIDPRGKDRVGPLRENLASYRPLVKDGETLAAAERGPSEPLDWSLTPKAAEYARQAHLAELDRIERHRRRDAGRSAILPAEATDAAFGDGYDEPLRPGDLLDDGFPGEGEDPPVTTDPFISPIDALAASARPEPDADPAAAARCFIGSQIISVPLTDPVTGEFREHQLVQPGQNVRLTTVKSVNGAMPEAVGLVATCADVFKSGMSEYDNRVVFMDIEKLQEVRGMLSDAADPTVGVGAEVRVRTFADGGDEYGEVMRMEGGYAIVRLGRWWEAGEERPYPLDQLTPVSRSVTTVQIKLKDDADPAVAVAMLKQAFPAERFSVGTWESKQGPLLAAVDMETTILNVLLFLIVAVAGFGILAIFYMIVVEKTRDIGILKALGAGSRGILTIFLSYGLSLGIVGAGVGCVLGLVFVRYINEVERFISYLTGRKVFDERIYYFPEIPTRVDPVTVLLVALGAVLIAVAASVLPARRAAALHPVQALRYE